MRHNKRYRKQSGLTLIEVLVALAIIAIAMTAAIKAISVDIRGISHLQEKTMALWVGEQVINEARVGALTLPSHESLHEETLLLGRTWYWVLSQAATPNPRIKEVTVRVYATQEDAEQGESHLITLTSYLSTLKQDENNKR